MNVIMQPELFNNPSLEDNYYRGPEQVGKAQDLILTIITKKNLQDNFKLSTFVPQCGLSLNEASLL